VSTSAIAIVLILATSTSDPSLGPVPSSGSCFGASVATDSP
jgi:hypothetical protein